MNKIEMGKTYRTRDGREVEVLKVGRKCPTHPTIALVTRSSGMQSLCGFDEFGFTCTGIEHPDDLIEVKPKRVAWLNVYPDGSGGHYPTLERANKSASYDRIACIRIEYTEGQLDKEPGQ